MNLFFIVIFVLMLSIYGGITYYIGRKGWAFLDASGVKPAKIFYWIIVWLIAFSFFIARIVEGRLPNIVGSIFSFVGAYWMGIMVYLIMLLVLGDITQLILRKFRLIPRGLINNRKFTAIKGLTVIGLVLVIVVYGRWNATNPKIVTYGVQLDKAAGHLKELNVVMLSDLHLGTLVNKRQLVKIVGEIEKLQPDIILMPGDIIDDRVDVFVDENMAEVFRKLNPPLGIYASMGNHEYIGGHAEYVEDVLEEAGIKMLRDEGVIVENSFYIVGREDGASQRFTKIPRRQIADILQDFNTEMPIIMLDHQPVDIDEAMEAGVDIMLSGHTHRGQLFPFRIFTKRLFKVDWGYEMLDNLHVIVTSGAGTWGPPIRVGHRSEIVYIKIIF